MKCWICGGDAVLAVAAIPAQRVNAEELSESRAEILREIHRVATATAIGNADVAAATANVADVIALDEAQVLALL